MNKKIAKILRRIETKLSPDICPYTANVALALSQLIRNFIHGETLYDETAYGEFCLRELRKLIRQNGIGQPLFAIHALQCVLYLL